jgi:catechol 2,3-dioxygenase-like lactoylglutathione lyase family enzyme
MEVTMSTTDAGTGQSSQAPAVSTIDFKIEVIALPVADVDRSKAFYAGLGWRLDADIVRGDAFRVVQFTPPHSEASIAFGKGLITTAPGSQQRVEMVVSDIVAAREDLISRGVEVGEIYHLDGGPVPGLDPNRTSYNSYATFSDPDGNSFLLQEVTTRLPGRLWED